MQPRTVPLEDTISEPTPKVRKPPVRNAADKKLKDAIASNYTSLGLALGGVALIRGDARFQASGEQFVDKADSLAETWMKLADNNDRIKRALRSFVETSTFAELIGLHVACLAPFAVGMVPPAFMAGMSEASQNGSGTNDN